MSITKFVANNIPHNNQTIQPENSHYVCSEKAVNWIYNSVEGRS